MQAYLSADTIFNNSGDIPAGGRVLTTSSYMLAPGASHSGSFSSGAEVNPSERPYLILMVDWWKKIDESNETNNTKAVLIATATPVERSIKRVSDPGTYIVETRRGAVETYQPPDWSQALRDASTNTTWIWSSYYLTYNERQYGSTRTFRETFNIPANSSELKGEIRIGADNFYAIYLNGQLIADKRQNGCNSPPGELWSCWNVNEHSFTPRVGSNELEIVVVNHPFDGDASSVIANPGGVIYRADISYLEWS